MLRPPDFGRKEGTDVADTYLPKNARQWAYFIGAVFVATVVVNTILNRLPANLASPLTSASRGF